MYLRHGLRRPNAAGVWGVGHGAQNSLLAYAHRILPAATPFCSLFPPLAALANVPLCTREPLGTRDADCHVGPLGLLAMTTVFCHSEASAHTDRGNPSFLRWTGVRAAEVVGPYGKERKPHQPPGSAAQSEAFAPWSRGMGGNRSRDHPRRGQQPGTIPQSRLRRDSSCCT